VQDLCGSRLGAKSAGAGLLRGLRRLRSGRGARRRIEADGPIAAVPETRDGMARSMATTSTSIAEADGVEFSVGLLRGEQGPIGTHAIVCWEPCVPAGVDPGPGRWPLAERVTRSHPFAVGLSTGRGMRRALLIRKGEISSLDQATSREAVKRLQTLWGLFCRQSNLDGKDREARLSWVAGTIRRQIGSFAS